MTGRVLMIKIPHSPNALCLMTRNLIALPLRAFAAGPRTGFPVGKEIAEGPVGECWSRF